ncbi:uncharacterized protein LOC110459361 [Mizuhopecten yessoensis]|uniref:PID domain-containing protein n=1 Tax=Mizuhopecten yessoensis TaxID=6573 RepID=A0A210Q4Q5_MIZYE|nr:uncharacterized protein LOC110459361 [Mizuhopecten yessoensis]OWF43701.1 hypothetical protein KP79_PYT04225 [Mizuhopecten yessoensis]
MSGAEDSSSVSSASEAMAGIIEDNSAVGETLNSEFYEDVLGRLDDLEISANLDIPDEENDEDSRNDDTNESIGAESSASDTSKDAKSEQGAQVAKTTKQEVSRSKSKTTPNKKPSVDSKDSKNIKSTGSVFSKLRRLTKSDKKSRKKPEESPLSEIKIEKLPQVFVAKYLGKKPTKGLFGLQHVRKPVDRMIGALKKDLSENEKVELPLTYVVVSSKGIEIREHAASRVKEVGNIGLVPIDFISYGVQDIKFWKVFTFIVVSELSSRAKTTECHAVLCDSDATARKMALSLAASFHVYKKKLNKEGKNNNFKVELRLPDELAEAFEEECDA